MVKRSKGGLQAAVQKEASSQKWRCLLSLYLGRDRLRISDVERMTGIHRNTLYRLYHDRMRLVDLDEIAVLLALFKLSSIGDFFQLIEASGETKSVLGNTKAKSLAGALPDSSEVVIRKKPEKKAAKRAGR